MPGSRMLFVLSFDPDSMQFSSPGAHIDCGEAYIRVISRVNTLVRSRRWVGFDFVEIIMLEGKCQTYVICNNSTFIAMVMQ